MSEWQTMETAPKDGTAYITYAPSLDEEYRFDIAGWDVENDCPWKYGCGYDYVTHWMPLPPPPTEAGQ